MSQISNKMHQEESKAIKIVYKILETLPKYTLKQFIYLLSLTIADEKGVRLDTLSRALTLVNNEIRVNLITLFKDFGVEDHLIHEIISNKSSSLDGFENICFDFKENYTQNNKTNSIYCLGEKKSSPKPKSADTESFENNVNIQLTNFEPTSQIQKYESSKESTVFKNVKNDSTKGQLKSNEPKRVLKKKYAKKARFSTEESNFIVSLVENNDITNWTSIAKACNSRFGGNKTGPQCHQHYFRVANSSISKNPWRKEEDEMLKKLVALYGFKWSQISQSLPGRPDTSCRRRWKAIQKNKD